MKLIRSVINANFATLSKIKRYNVIGTGVNNASITTIKEGQKTFVIRTDIPVSQGGKNGAPQPVNLLLAALIGCKQG